MSSALIRNLLSLILEGLFLWVSFTGNKAILSSWEDNDDMKGCGPANVDNSLKACLTHLLVTDVIFPLLC